MQRTVPRGPSEPGWPWMDPKRLRELLHDEGLTVSEAADRLGCHADTVRKWADRHDLLGE